VKQEQIRSNSEQVGVKQEQVRSKQEQVWVKQEQIRVTIEAAVQWAKLGAISFVMSDREIREGRSLAGANFSGADIRGASFVDAELQGALVNDAGSKLVCVSHQAGHFQADRV
jgi:hypothetical protein